MTETIEILKKLVSIPSTLGETAEIEEFAASWLGRVKEADVEVVRVGNLGNDVVARIIKDRNNKTIILNGHLDTVEVCEGWSYDPFKPFAKGDKLYGLGSADMKAGVAIAMSTFKKLASIDSVNVIFAGTVDEEGNSAGAFALLEKGLKGDLCLIPEPSGGNLMMGCRGRLVFEAEVRGTSAHGARPSDGVNAIVEAGKFITALDTVPLPEHGKLGKGSFCVLEISGGTKTLSVPDKCWLKIDRHYVLEETKEQMLNELKDVARKSSRAEFNISLWKARPTPFLEPYITANEGIVKLFTSSVGGGFTYGKSVGDYNAFAKIAPTVVYGPQGKNWHGADEFVSLSSVEECLRSYERFVEALMDVTHRAF